MLAHVTGATLPSHRMVPLVQASADPATVRQRGADLDAVLDGPADGWAQQLLDTVGAVASREVVPRAVRNGDVGFQVTRGLLGVSI
jgi:hypothetical protein